MSLTHHLALDLYGGVSAHITRYSESLSPVAREFRATSAILPESRVLIKNHPRSISTARFAQPLRSVVIVAEHSAQGGTYLDDYLDEIGTHVPCPG